MSATATLRHYQPLDLDACREMWVELTDWHRTIYDNPRIGGDDPGAQFDEHLARVGPDNLWVAVADDEVVGLSGLIIDGDGGEIEPVVVRESHRGQGIGRRLAQAVIDAARERGVRQLSVRPVARNASAIRFFRSLGLDIVGHVELFMKCAPSEYSGWTPGPTLAGEEFRH